MRSVSIIRVSIYISDFNFNVAATVSSLISPSLCILHSVQSYCLSVFFCCWNFWWKANGISILLNWHEFCLKPELVHKKECNSFMAFVRLFKFSLHPSHFLLSLLIWNSYRTRFPWWCMSEVCTCVSEHAKVCSATVYTHINLGGLNKQLK